MDSDDGKRNGFRKVLVLNTTYSPINICNWKRAMILLFKGKAEALEQGSELINNTYILPLVVRLKKYVSLPYNGMVLTRKNVYLRDNHTCQYCGKAGGNLTIDHIIPKSRGGYDNWENVVTSCIRCNNRKGDRTLEEASLKLIGTPYKPPSSLYLQMTRFGYAPESWYNYFFRKASLS